MEEKERYVIDCCDDLIFDTEKEYYPSGDTICKTLNRQDKRIKELEETNKVLSNELTKNSILKQDHIETCCGIPIFEIPKIKEENEQLKQQLHDLPKKIIGEIEKCFTEYLPLKDRTGAWFYGKLNEILKKYGGENESNND